MFFFVFCFLIGQEERHNEAWFYFGFKAYSLVQILPKFISTQFRIRKVNKSISKEVILAIILLIRHMFITSKVIFNGCTYFSRVSVYLKQYLFHLHTHVQEKAEHIVCILISESRFDESINEYNSRFYTIILVLQQRVVWKRLSIAEPILFPISLSYIRDMS